MYKLHLGCGSTYLEGYINIDIRESKAMLPKKPDLLCDVRALPYKPNLIEEIKVHHVIEHLGRHEAIKALGHWHKMIKPGGKLDIECPDVSESMKAF